jgi:hypothetical protein
MKIIEIKKNRSVNGRRALNLGLNPHSKGLIFSDINKFFFLKSLPKERTTNDKINDKKKTLRKYKIN